MIRTAIVLTGLAGLVVVGYTARFYAAMGDRLATGLCLLMGGVVVMGVVELLRHHLRAVRFQRELVDVKKAGTLEAIDGATPMLRAILHARLDRVPYALPVPSFTPYLIGLCVMLGLLGTFLGLFETLRGASSVLQSSADVEALRQGLAQPMAGLMRSFGTSAAGVTTSAMLGLASVFGRRSIARRRAASSMPSKPSRMRAAPGRAPPTRSARPSPR